MTGDSIVLERGESDAQTRIPLASVALLEVSRGKEWSRVWKGGLIGLIGGALVGAAMVPIVDDGLTAADWVGVGVFLGAPTGMLIGAVSGGLTKTGEPRIRLPPCGFRFWER